MWRKSYANFLFLESALLAGGVILEVKFGSPMWVWGVILALSIIGFWWTFPRKPAKTDINSNANSESLSDETNTEPDSFSWSEESLLILELQKRKQRFLERFLRSDVMNLISALSFVVVMAWALPRVM